MKGLLISVCGLLILQSCEKYTLTSNYRAQVLYNAGKERGTLSGDAEAPKADTSVYVSAVIVPREYDWRRDSLYGAVQCELQLLKDGIPQFTMNTGTLASSSPDTHHLLGGHLYTEYVGPDGTVICRDGMELFRYPQREMLKGILIKEEDVYTLGRSLDGGGFFYRRNGEILLRQDEGEPFGDFSNPAYGRNGALYEYCGSVCFCFKTASDCYQVVDGVINTVDTPVSAFRIKDMRPFGQPICYVADYTTSALIFTPKRTYTLPTGNSWQSVSLFERDGVPWFIADSPLRTICRPVSQAEKEQSGVSFVGEDNFIYEGRSRFFSARCGGSTFSLSDDAGQILYIRDSTYFFGRNSVFCLGDDAYILINPRERDRPPSVWNKGRETPYDMNGYLSGIEVMVSLPN
jgi:hypothetical protein